MADKQNPQQQDAPSTGGAVQFQADLEAANEQIKNLTEIAKRALADLQNYRKRVEEERAAFSQEATIDLLTELLPILDNFNRAFGSVPEDIQKTVWFKGALQIEQQLVGIMRKQGIKEMTLSVGQKLDPKIHEAINMGPGEKDTVIEEYEKGYLLGEKVIRPAKVKVGDGTAYEGKT